jgi:hypothetical protein
MEPTTGYEGDGHAERPSTVSFCGHGEPLPAQLLVNQDIRELRAGVNSLRLIARADIAACDAAECPYDHVPGRGLDAHC